MSRRTAEASKAVRTAWKEEQDRVRMGKGTRDWTQKQQEEILELGRAYYHSDDPNDIYDGKAFEGHHMKSVEAYPEFQGDSANIQFLSKSEHKEAHRGDYKIASNWYFDPVTHEFTDFGEGKYIPCTVIDLSDPVCTISINAEKIEAEPSKKADAKENGTSPPTSESKNAAAPKPTVEKKLRKESASLQKENKKTPPPKVSAADTKAANEKGKTIKDGLEALGSKVKSGGKIAGRFIAKHWKKIAAFGLALGAAAVEEKLRSSNSGSSGDDFSHDSDYNSPDYSTSDEDETLENENDLEEDENTEISSKGTPKSPHDRIGYWGDRWKKDENGNRYKSPSWISPTRIHSELDDEESEDE